MDEAEKKRRDELFREELTRLETEEAAKKELFDKSIGGDNALRPSDQFISDMQGAQKTRQELAQEAGKAADKRYEQERAGEENALKFDRSVRAHNQSLEGDDGSRKSFAERVQEHNANQDHDQGEQEQKDKLVFRKPDHELSQDERTSFADRVRQQTSKDDFQRAAEAAEQELKNNYSRKP